MNKIKTILSILLLSALLLSCQDKTDSSIKNNDISLTRLNEIKLPEEKAQVISASSKTINKKDFKSWLLLCLNSVICTHKTSKI